MPAGRPKKYLDSKKTVISISPERLHQLQQAHIQEQARRADYIKSSDFYDEILEAGLKAKGYK